MGKKYLANTEEDLKSVFILLDSYLPSVSPATGSELPRLRQEVHCPAPKSLGSSRAFNFPT